MSQMENEKKVQGRKVYVKLISTDAAIVDSNCCDVDMRSSLRTISPPTTINRSSAVELPLHSKLYGTDFWLAYLANLLLTSANALLFRFADFVDFLHGSAATAGLIVGIGTGLSVPARLWVGRLIDRHGPPNIWIGSSLLFVVSCLSFIPVTAIGPLIYLARIGFACAIAGMFSCFFVYSCTGVPVQRRAELIGMLGTAGFIGMAISPPLGDWIFRSLGNGQKAYNLIFLIAAVMGIGYLVIVNYLSQHPSNDNLHASPPLRMMLIKYWPGTLATVAMMMGVAMVVPGTFLVRFCAARDLGGIGTFFLFYTSTAFAVRIIGRRIPERLGRRKSVLLGLLCMAISMVLYLPVQNQWHLVAPALPAAIAHALLFPSVATLGTESFPECYRATGISLILGLVDLGTLFGAPALGAIIDNAGFEAMFLSTALLAVLVASSFTTAIVLSLRQSRRQQSHHSVEREACATAPDTTTAVQHC